FPQTPAVGAGGVCGAVAAAPARPDPDPVRARRPARLAGRSAGRQTRAPGAFAPGRGDPGVRRDAAGTDAGDPDPGADGRAPDRDPGRGAAAVPRLVRADRG